MEECAGSLSDVENFLRDYRKELYKLCDDAWSVFQECYKSIGRENSYGFFIDIKKKIESMENFCNIEGKSEELEQARATCFLQYDQLAMHSPDYNPKSDKWNFFEQKVQEIIDLKELFINMLLDKARTAYEEIKVCPYGKQKNKNNNASLFQKKVLEFFDWLFISELKRVNTTEIENGRLRRDGVYKVLGNFDTSIRCGFQFRELIIECKNFEKPKYPSLMQLFVYTLSFQDSEISKVPLSLLISRKNPDKLSTIWRVNCGIFNKPIKKETRLILFFDDCDLGEMLEKKETGIDSALVLKEKIDALVRWNIKYGGV